MKRLLLVLGALAVAGLGAAGPKSAFACSVGPDFDAVESADIIVAGRVTGWELITHFTRWDPKSAEPPVDDRNYYGPYQPIRLYLEVERVYKGPRVTSIGIIDAASLEIYDGVQQWVGSSGTCGAFDSDPSGQYVILGLGHDRFGRYRPSLPLAFFVGAEPAGDRYERALKRVNAEAGDDFPWLPAAVVAVLGPLAFLAGAAFLWRRGESHNG